MSTGPAGSASTQKTLAQREKNKADQHVGDVRWLLSDAHGRRLLWAWMNRANLTGDTFTGEPFVTIHNEGKRALAITMMAEAQQHDPENYALMVAEQMQALKDDQTHKHHAESQARQPDADET